MKRNCILQLMAALMFVFAAAGCTEAETPHTHTFSPDWTTNETYHWHASTCGHSAETAGLKEHNFTDGICTVCGYRYVPPHVHKFDSVEYDEYRHWGLCVACQKEVNERHSWQDNVCTVCGYDAGGSRGLIWSEDGILIDATAAKEIVIPETYNGISVTEIGEGAFSDCTELEKITLPDTLKTIGANAFSGCTSLSEISLPNGLLIIGEGAFWGCNALTSVTVPDSVSEIGEGALGGCAALESVYLPFVGQSESSEVKYPFGYLFGTKGYSGGIWTRQYYSLPDGMNSISYALPVNLKSVTVRGNLPYGAFRNCKNLETVILSDMTEIGDRAFDSCTGIEEIILPSGVMKIGDYAFSGCTGLKAVFIGSDVTFIGKSAFSGCSALQKVEFEEIMGWLCTSAPSAQTGEPVPEFDEWKAVEFLTKSYCEYYWKRI